VAELADAQDLGSCAARREGSSPSSRIFTRFGADGRKRHAFAVVHASRPLILRQSSASGSLFCEMGQGLGGRRRQWPLGPNRVGRPCVCARERGRRVPSLKWRRFRRGGVPWRRTSTTTTGRAFEVMSKRRRGYPERDARQARAQGRPRRQGASREARPQRPLPVRERLAVQAVLPQSRVVSTAWRDTTTSGKRARILALSRISGDSP
jgi:hypothetical protein